MNPLFLLALLISHNLQQIAKSLQIESLLNKDYSILSEGQKQLVQIARIIMQDTLVLLLDEPDSALDFDNRCMMFKILQRLIKFKRKSALIVLHNPLYVNKDNFLNQSAHLH